MRLRLFQRPARPGISVLCAARRVDRTPESGSAEENCFSQTCEGSKNRIRLVSP